MKNRFTSSIAGASILLSGFSIFSKGIGFIREMIYAKNFGLSSEFDLFLTCAALPIVINTAVLYLGQHYFIPAYNKLASESDSDGIEFLNNTFWNFIIAGILISLLLLISSKIIIGFFLSNLGYDLQAKGLRIFVLFLITLPFNFGMSIVTAYMQAKFKFIYPAISQLVVNITIIIVVFFFTGLFKIFVLPISFIAAYFLGFLMIIRPVMSGLGLKRYLKKRESFKTVDGKNLFYLVVIESLSLSYILIDRYFIGKIPAGGLAALNYALVIYLLPVSIFSITLTTTMFSKFAFSSARSANTLKLDFNKAIGINSFIIIPIMFVIFLWGDVFLKIFYERGAFTASDTIRTHKVLQFYIVSLVFYSAYLIAVKLFYSINRYALIMYLSIAAFFLKILLNYLFVDKLFQNGLALSTSLIYLFLFVLAFYYAVRQINMNNYWSCYVSIVYYLLNGILSYLIMRVCFIFITDQELWAKACEMILFLVIYVLNSFYLDNYESRVLKKTSEALFGRILGKLT